MYADKFEKAERGKKALELIKTEPNNPELKALVKGIPAARLVDSADIRFPQIRNPCYKTSTEAMKYMFSNTTFAFCFAEFGYSTSG